MMRVRTAFVLGLLLVLGAAATGCARSGGGDGVASAGGTPTASASAATGGGRPDPVKDQENFLKYAACMREHGIDMPDPQFDGGGIAMTLPEGADKAKVDAANEQCKQFLPNGGQPLKADPEMQERMRKFSQCMRENGVPDFPDPGEDGGIRIDGSKGGGLDPRSEAFKKAEAACKDFQPKRPGSDDEGPATNQKTETGGGA
ncbi:hypothetical protein Daura_45560 [Dactylosporangium aurantiacum]|uniref:Secreted protein n=1 Tax=Dactylosporangium aurantiacum TaxID=35754 RepID=A0A9Q9IE58_9ACTN|nr:hypothetical protein [Dactylosporangium aurantiacum]MDG6108076.1 hypothetical protein [Dactylosporangium aurantiacum]UWZ53706.1 hypothetical protein Daura_45560 [Dactylosporangium aurantiacum]